MAFASITDDAPLDTTAPDTDAADADTDDRVHHHARIDPDGALAGSNKILTLCGLRLARPRPDAALLPCCPLCAARMGRPCR